MAVVTINDFIELETIILGEQEPIETSHYTGVSDFFESHLIDSIKDGFYSIKTGDKITIKPSSWAVNFRQEKKLPESHDYDKKYEVVNINIEYHDKNKLYTQAEKSVIWPIVKVIITFREL